MARNPFTNHYASSCMLVKVDKFILLVNFVILDCEVDIDVWIIFRRPFLAIGMAVVDIERGDLRFKVNYEKVVLNICKTLQRRKISR